MRTKTHEKDMWRESPRHSSLSCMSLPSPGTRYVDKEAFLMSHPLPYPNTRQNAQLHLPTPRCKSQIEDRLQLLETTFGVAVRTGTCLELLCHLLKCLFSDFSFVLISSKIWKCLWSSLNGQRHIMSFDRMEESFVVEWTYGAEPLDNLDHDETFSWVR